MDPTNEAFNRKLDELREGIIDLRCMTPETAQYVSLKLIAEAGGGDEHAQDMLVAAELRSKARRGEKAEFHHDWGSALGLMNALVNWWEDLVTTRAGRGELIDKEVLLEAALDALGDGRRHLLRFLRKDVCLALIGELSFKDLAPTASKINARWELKLTEAMRESDGCREVEPFVWKLVAEAETPDRVAHGSLEEVA